MKRTLLTLATLGLVVGACGEANPTTPGTVASASVIGGGNGVLHKVSVGSNDACAALGAGNGCDGNFSLIAIQKADGSVSGQWNDTFAGGGEGLHIAIDCLNVVDNGAVIGGVITHGTANGEDVSGQRALTAVMDNGTSANDPADQISFSFFGLALSCTDLTPANFPLNDLTTGQVKVK